LERKGCGHFGKIEEEEKNRALKSCDEMNMEKSSFGKGKQNGNSSLKSNST
jgi:hypothetical protein